MPSASPFLFRPHPHLYEINTWAWLEELSAKFGQRISLANVPSSEWNQIAALGFDFVWLMGIWERSPAGRRVFQTDPSNFPGFDQSLPEWKLSQIVGSPYSVRQYQPDPRIGSWDDVDRVRDELHARRIKLVLDFVPNHTAPDHPWVSVHPEFYLRGSQADFRRDPSSFYLVELRDPSAEPLLFAHGRDPYFPPWRDTLQLNYFEPTARTALIGQLREISRHCDGLRCDMAMLVLNDIFARTWAPLLARQKPPVTEFWSDAITALPPEFVWLAEVYWNCESPMQKLGFQFTYDKGFYDALREGQIDEIHVRLASPLAAQSHAVRFLENHDEDRSAAVFGAAKLEAAATLLATLPGMRLYHQGQLDGRKIHLPIPLACAAPEPPDPQTTNFYERILQLSNHPVFHSGEWKLLEVRPTNDGSFRNLIAYQWTSTSERKLIVVNVSNEISQGRVAFDDGILAAQQYTFLDQLHDVPYLRAGAEIAGSGLYVRLDGFHAHLFSVAQA